MALIDNTYEEFVNMRRLNFKNWRIVDVDNYMKGNSFFNKVVSHSEFKNNIEKVLGKNDERLADMSEPDVFNRN